jgi:hypothetical protein
MRRPILLLLPLLLLVAACGSEPQDALDGTWVLAGDDPGLDQRMTFDDKYVSVTMILRGEERVREYRIREIAAGEDGRLVMEWVDRNLESVPVTAELLQDELTLDFNGERFRFRRE